MLSLRMWFGFALGLGSILLLACGESEPEVQLSEPTPAPVSYPCTLLKASDVEAVMKVGRPMKVSASLGGNVQPDGCHYSYEPERGAPAEAILSPAEASILIYDANRYAFREKVKQSISGLSPGAGAYMDKREAVAVALKGDREIVVSVFYPRGRDATLEQATRLLSTVYKNFDRR